MKKITAGAFKKNCIAILNEVQSKRETIVVTKCGKPITKLEPITAKKQEDIIGFYVGKGAIVGDVVSPALSLEEWGELG